MEPTDRALLDPVVGVLLVMLDNQAARTRHALEGIEEREFLAAPGGDCHSVQQIGRHLVQLRQLQLLILTGGQPAGAPPLAGSAAELMGQLTEATAPVRQAIMTHEPGDWLSAPASPRPGPWGSDATIVRFARPFNDFTNHLGAIRAIRRILGRPAPGVQ
ncbi:MAG: DinB family protein [Phycisphaeraceae bacterium]|nr:DinB family protein [Phycisphaeraceae bacterium]